MKKFVSDEEDGNRAAVQTGAGVKNKDDGGVTSLILRLAKAHGYDETGRIRGPEGSFIDGTNVGKLVMHAFKPEHFLYGIPQFCKLLRDLGIERLPNENLSVLLGTLPKTQPPPPTPPAAALGPPPLQVHARPTPLVPPPPPLMRMVPPPDCPKAPASVQPHEVSLPPSDDDWDEWDDEFVPTGRPKRQRQPEGEELRPLKKLKTLTKRQSRLTKSRWMRF